MRVGIFIHPGKKHQLPLSEAICKGLEIHGDVGRVFHFSRGKTFPKEDWSELVMLVSFTPPSRELFDLAHKQGKEVITVDRGISHIRFSHWMASWNDSRPTAYFQRISRPADRFEKLGLRCQPVQLKPGGTVLLAGSSQSYYDWHGLGKRENTDLLLLNRLRKLTNCSLIYRPKADRRNQSSGFAGFKLSPWGTESLPVLFPEMRCLVTYGSNACAEAILAGVPTIVLGNGLAKPLAGDSLDSIIDLRVPSPDEVQQWAFDLAYQQWTMAEFESGLAWKELLKMKRC